jgi:hypothetical protein
MINSDGLHTCVLATYDLFDYLAYGDGIIVDNATALTNELGRVLFSEQVAYTDYFENIFAIDAATGNGNTLIEYGLSVANTGDISTTQAYYPMIKTAGFEIIVYSTITYSGVI